MRGLSHLARSSSWHPPLGLSTPVNHSILLWTLRSHLSHTAPWLAEQVITQALVHTAKARDIPGDSSESMHVTTTASLPRVLHHRGSPDILQVDTLFKLYISLSLHPPREPTHSTLAVECSSCSVAVAQSHGPRSGPRGLKEYRIQWKERLEGAVRR